MKYILITLSIFSFSSGSTKYTNEVLVKCIDTLKCKEILAPYNFKNTSKLTSKIYLLQLESTKDAKDISKILEKNEAIDYAHPNYIRTRKRR